MRLTARYRRSARWWVSVLCGGVTVAAAVTVLKVDASAPASVQLTGNVPGTGTARLYDIVVSAPGPDRSGGAGGRTANPAGLDTLSGGITLAQYDKIRQLAGVEVAAPLTMVGYVPFTASVPVDVPTPSSPGTPRRVTVTIRLRSDNGLSTVTWDDVTMAYPGSQQGSRSATVSIRLDWTFQLPLVAVDPVAEARLLHLDAAVTSGSYLPATATPPSGPVPMLMAGSVASDEVAEVTVDPQAGDTAGGQATLTTASAYQRLIGDAREAAGNVRTYWTAGPVNYGPAADGALTPRPVATNLASAWDGAYMWAGAPADAGVLDVPFRSLTQHTALGDGAMVQAIGVFDPAKVASAPATPSPYRPELLTGADARSRQLLGGHPLAGDGAPVGYPSSAASLVVPLADIGAFTSGYADVDGAAPIGTIRVRVAGAAGDGATSQGRIRAVAQEIVRATGLHVQAVLGTTATTRVVDLPAGLHGRPPLRVAEVWYGSDIHTIVWSGLSADSVVLSELELIAGEVVIAWGAWRLMRARRGELATLRALGWRRRQLGGQLLAEFALIAMVAVAAAVLAGYAIGAALARPPYWAWLLLGVCTVIAVVGVEKRPPLRSVIPVLAGPLRAVRPRRRPTGRRRLRRVLRAPSHTLLSVLVIAVACTALSLEVARWAWHGAAGTWAERPVSWQGTVVDLAAAAVLVALATFTVADLSWVTLRERAPEVRTLRAMGWSPWALARLLLWNAVWVGLAGGLAAGAVDLIGGLAVAGAAPRRLIAVVGLAAVAGVALSLLAAGLSAISRHVLDDANN